MAFPTSPSNNDVHKEGNRSFVYDSTLGTWDQVKETDRFSVEAGGGVAHDLTRTGVTFPAGHVLQVLYHSQVEADGDTGTSSSTYVAIAGLSQAITILASSKVFVHFDIHIYLQQHTAGNWSTANLKIFRDSTDIYTPAGSNPYVHGRYTSDAADRDMRMTSISYLDTPGSAGTYTYSAKVSSKNGFTVGSYPAMGQSNVTLMEVAV